MRLMNIGIYLFMLWIPLSAATIMVDTVSEEPQEMWDTQDFQNIRAMENGLIDACFDKGWMVFNVSSVESTIEIPTAAAVLQAEKVGAQYLVRLQADNEDRKMLYLLYSVSGQVVLSSGEWFLDDITEDNNNQLKDLFYLAGQKVLDSLTQQD